MKTKIVNTFNGIALQYEETGEYIVVKNENYIVLQDSTKDDAKEIRVSSPLTSKIVELRRETMENKETLIRYFAKQAAGNDHPLNEDFVRITTQLLFSKRIYSEVTHDGPVLYLEDYRLELDSKGCLQLVLRNNTQNVVIDAMGINIYKYLGESTRPREVLFKVLVQMASKGAYPLCKYLMLKSKIYEFADLLMKISEGAGDNAIFKQKFEEKILGNESPDKINIKTENNCITINNNGKIIKIDNGDAVALTIDGDIITISSKGMKEDISKAKSMEEAVHKVKTRIAEVMIPCGSKAKTLYVTKIKPVAGDFAKSIVTPIFMFEEEKDNKKDTDGNSSQGKRENVKSSQSESNTKSFNKGNNKKIKNSSTVERDIQNNNKPTNTLNYILFAGMIAVIVLLFIVGGF